VAAVACAVLAVAAPAGSERVPATRTTVFALDVSASVDPEVIERAVGAIERAAAAAPAHERVAVVAFAAEAVRVVGPSRGPLNLAERLAAAVGPMDRDRSDVRAALACAAAEGPARVVLMTDGHVDRIGTSADVRVPLRGEWRDDVIALELQVPPAVRAGEAFDAVLRVRSPVALATTAQLVVDDVPVVESLPVALRAGGETLVRFRNLQAEPLGRQGLHTLRAFVRGPQDSRPRNNMAAACCFVRSKPRVLVALGAEGDAASLERILGGQGFEVTRADAADLGPVADELPEFDLIALSAGDASRAAPASVRLIEREVRAGAGLIVAARADNARGDFPAALEALMPVAFKTSADGPPPRQPTPQPPRPNVRPQELTYEAPSIALLLLVDTSGSMAGENLALAKEACLATAETLTPLDAIGVMGFNQAPYLINGFRQAGSRGVVERGVMGVMAHGGTDVHRALAGAALEIARRRESIRHVILLSDGLTPAANWDELLAAFKENRISVTTVCAGVGDGFDAQLMSLIAQRTGGRFIFSDNFKKVPQIFTHEARQVVRTARDPSKDSGPTAPTPPDRPQPPSPRPGAEGPTPEVETPRRVTRADPHEATRGIEAFPDVWGLIPSEARPTAVVALRGGTLPLLASWRVGLGQVAVWTSDLEGSWGREWRGTDAAAKLMAQLARSLSRGTEGPEPRPIVLGPEPDGTFRFRVEAAAGDESARAEALTPEPRPIALLPAGASALEGVFRPPEPNTTYRLKMAQGERSALFGVIEAYPAELRLTGADASFFDRATELEALGTLWDAAPAPLEKPRMFLPGFLLAAALLLLADVAARRWAEARAS
jgi:Mg-chelatase subunit ChlD